MRQSRKRLSRRRKNIQNQTNTAATDEKQWLKWGISSVVVPLTVAIMATGYLTKKSTEIVYKEVPIVEKFDALDYLALKKDNFWIYDGKATCASEDSKTNQFEYRKKSKSKQCVVN